MDDSTSANNWQRDSGKVEQVEEQIQGGRKILHVLLSSPVGKKRELILIRGGDDSFLVLNIKETSPEGVDGCNYRHSINLNEVYLTPSYTDPASSEAFCVTLKGHVLSEDIFLSFLNMKDLLDFQQAITGYEVIYNAMDVELLECPRLFQEKRTRRRGRLEMWIWKNSSISYHRTDDLSSTAPSTDPSMAPSSIPSSEKSSRTSSTMSVPILVIYLEPDLCENKKMSVMMIETDNKTFIKKNGCVCGPKKENCVHTSISREGDLVTRQYREAEDSKGLNLALLGTYQKSKQRGLVTIMSYIRFEFKTQNKRIEFESYFPTHRLHGPKKSSVYQISKTVSSPKIELRRNVTKEGLRVERDRGTDKITPIKGITSYQGTLKLEPDERLSREEEGTNDDDNVTSTKGNILYKDHLTKEWDAHTAVSTENFDHARGDENIDRLLPTKGLNDGPYDEWMQAVPVRGYDNKMKSLLDIEAKPSPEAQSSGYALQRAAEAGHEDVIRLLLENKTNIDDLQWGHALTAAARKGHEGVTRLLLEKKTNIDDLQWLYALCAAAGEGHEGVTRLLLAKKTYIDDRQLGFVLRTTARQGHENIVGLLLEKNTNIDVSQLNYALRAAAGQGHESVKRLLLEKKKTREMGVEQMLLEKNTNMNSLKRSHEVDAAVRKGHKGMERTMLEKEMHARFTNSSQITTKTINHEDVTEDIVSHSNVSIEEVKAMKREETCKSEDNIPDINILQDRVTSDGISLDNAISREGPDMTGDRVTEKNFSDEDVMKGESNKTEGKLSQDHVPMESDNEKSTADSSIPYSSVCGRINSMLWRKYPDILEYFCSTLHLKYLEILYRWNRYWEPRIGARKVRISWTCRCGQVLWDDFHELRPGAAVDLQKDLDFFGRIRVQSATDSISSAHSTSVFRNSDDSEIITLPSEVSRKYDDTGFAGSANVVKRNRATEEQQQNSALLDKKFLLMCLCKPADTLRLSQYDVKDINNDVELFQLLKTVYAAHRGRFARLFSAKKIKSIQFRKFERHPRERVVILPGEDILPHRTNPTACHQDHKSCDTTYDIYPTPPDLEPYLGPNGIEHLLNHPHEAQDEGNNLPVQDVWLKRFPKKEKTKLTACPPYKYGIGWGIEFQECWYINWVLKTGVVACVLAATIFLICWWKFRDDIQSASNVAALLLAYNSLLLTVYGVYYA